ncbi:MAG: tRNA (adenosine(37)-N6)-threonylcarbamoyltransferase complex dimerization subunit type 1 TsaB [Planctomycetes bacterium]|nr:tRNA (adenosine(37)-N6)-threonylcarbamoyltransferase complex dimerization subunit type 1 TsaB [Planctomycetota bacterium]
MTVVALETSHRAASVAVRHDGRTASARLESSRAHASDLFPRLEALFQELGARPSSIATVIVGTGPGSYTGLRVGIATALGLARGSGAALVGVPSGETLVFERVAPGREAVYLLDARSNELYFARYRRTPTGVEAVEPPCVLRPDALAPRLPPDLPIFGDATVADAAQLDPAARARLVADAVPSASALLELGLLRLAERGPTPPDALEPLYLRPFAATQRKR